MIDPAFTDIEGALEALYDHCELGNEQRATESVLIWFEALLRAGEFDRVNAAFGAADASRLAPAVICAMLSITSKDTAPKLWRRTSFLIRAEASLIDRLGKERTSELLRYRR